MKTNQNKLFSKISFLAGKKTIPINTIRACFKKTFSVQPFFKIKNDYMDIGQRLMFY